MPYDYEEPENLSGDDGLFKQLKEALIEQGLGAELPEHLTLVTRLAMAECIACRS